VQRTAGLAFAPIWVPLTMLALRSVGRYRIDDVESPRREYRRVFAEATAKGTPLLICANHLTLIDSFLIAWALGSPAWYLRHYAALPWNVPERRNFAVSLGQRALTYLMKCLPITRGGNRGDVARVLAEFAYVVSRGDVGLLFPEAGRSRTGRVDVDAAAVGVGRIIRSLPGCRVLCVYLRGRGQETFSDYPARGERFHVALEHIRPETSHDGLRGSRDVARQVLGVLAGIEQRHFDAR
jgi:1-acyl-sn-glycerol-3-phosphate acyltransferase